MKSWAYWNDPGIEAGKAFGAAKVEEYLSVSGLREHVNAIKREVMPLGRILDLGAGTGWMSALLSQYSFVEEITSIDFSLPRANLFDETMRVLQGDETKVIFTRGDMHQLGAFRGRMDQVWMCQAFHHSQEPLRLLNEIRRSLKPRGVCVIGGEEPVSWLWMLGFKLGLIHADQSDGDQFYTRRQYERMFKEAGFTSWTHRGRKYMWFELRTG